MTNKNMTTIERVIIITRPTELEELVARFNTVGQARFYLEQSGQDFNRVELANKNYGVALKKVKSIIPDRCKQQVLKRALISRFSFDQNDLVIVLGQDGLVSNVAKYLDAQAIFAINPDPNLYDGVLLPFNVNNMAKGLAQVLAGQASIKPVTMAQVKTSDGQNMLAFNDFFIGAASHVSARYELEFNDLAEVQSSSGIIVSTGAGSTGWLKSIYRGAANTVAAFGGTIPQAEINSTYAWDTSRLPFVVREPFPSKATGVDLTNGEITAQKSLTVHSRMATNGVIFSDGIEADFIAFNAGMSAVFSLADKQAQLISRD